jgi:hypothetical protein
MMTSKTIAFLKTYAQSVLPECDEEAKKEIYREVRLAVDNVKMNGNEKAVVCDALNAVERIAMRAING